jgi:hypothetical protein
MRLEPSSCCTLASVGMAAVCAVSTSLAAQLVAAGPARANCYELIGCTDSEYFKLPQLEQLGCQPLWDVRNTIYKENGYCFHTAKAIAYFGNEGCKYEDAAVVPLNKYERHNVSAIKEVETQKGCL